MIRFQRLATVELNLFSKNIIRQHKSRQCTLHVGYVRAGEKEPEILSQRENKKIPKFRQIAFNEKLVLDDLIIKQQDPDEVENIFKEIAKGDAEIEKQLRVLLYEIMLRREEENMVPNYLGKKHWEELLKIPSVSMRDKYLSFLYKIEKKRESEKIKDALKRRERPKLQDICKTVPHMYYGLGGCSMFLRLYPQTLLTIQDVRAHTNKLFAPPIIFDCSYQEYMNKVNTKYCARQMALSFQLNRGHPYPCSLQLVNLKKDDLLVEYLQVYIQKIQECDNPLEIHEKSYLDLYPKEKLVYLTPHTKNELVDFMPDDIFIIGAYVDKGLGIQASLAKAKQDGLRMAKLPLDRYLLWRKGTKSLTLNNVLNILLDMRFYNNWGKALQSIPTRNLKA